jgi:hypothetical protein
MATKSPESRSGNQTEALSESYQSMRTPGGGRPARALWYKVSMTRGLALWAGLAALAAIVVAGVTIAVFPHEKRTALPGPILVPQVAPAPPVAISFPAVVVGRTASASLSRGGAATPMSRDAGEASTKISRVPPTMRSYSTAPSMGATPRVGAAPTPVKKATTKRPTSIGGTTASNGDVGLASGGSIGEQPSGRCGACP